MLKYLVLGLVLLVAIVVVYKFMSSNESLTPTNGDEARWCGTISGTLHHTIGSIGIEGTWSGVVKDKRMDATWEVSGIGYTAQGVLTGQWDTHVTIDFMGDVDGREVLWTMDW
jgi:hypothetical protein